MTVTERLPRSWIKLKLSLAREREESFHGDCHYLLEIRGTPRVQQAQEGCAEPLVTRET